MLRAGKLKRGLEDRGTDQAAAASISSLSSRLADVSSHLSKAVKDFMGEIGEDIAKSQHQGAQDSTQGEEFVSFAEAA